MPFMLVRNRVRDYDAWREVFDAQLGIAHESALEVVSVWRSLDDPQEVYFLLSIGDMDKARAYVADPANAEVGERAGVIGGEITYVEAV